MNGTLATDIDHCFDYTEDGCSSANAQRQCWNGDSGKVPTPSLEPQGIPQVLRYSLDHVDAAALDQPGQPLEQAGDDAVLVGVDAGHVDAVERGADAELLGLTGLVGDLGRVQQGLGGDAADVEAGAAEVALLDETDGQPQLRRPERTGISA